MSESKIIHVWETGRGEEQGGWYYVGRSVPVLKQLADKSYAPDHALFWTVGRIEVGATGNGLSGYYDEIKIYDTDGKHRATLPAWAWGREYCDG
jgi:hypothetical protein